MKLKKENRPTRFALIVFIGLVIFCIAQLSWWIIFQIDLSKQLRDYQIKFLEQRIEHLTYLSNRCFQQRADMAARGKHLIEGRSDFFDSLLTDRVVIGYSLRDKNLNTYEITGTIDSTFYFSIDRQTTIYFDPQFPAGLIEESDSRLVFIPQGLNGGENGTWVKNGMFAVNPDLLQDINDKSRRTIMMYASEGSFFILIILFGAFLIYRTLRRSEDLKYRQQNFIHSVTHEFRTPLTALRLYLETLQSGQVDDKKSGEIYGKMLDDCRRLDNMIDNVLEAGRSGREDFKLDLTETDLSNDLAEYLNSLDSLIKSYKGTLKSELEPGIRARTDYHALGRALKAVIENAIKYSHPDNRIVEVKLARERRNAVISITDNGMGIPSGELKNIFDRFYRIGNDSTRRVKGTGLGLYLVKQTIDAHGGRIDAHSAGLNMGSKFIIKLPLVQ